MEKGVNCARWARRRWRASRDSGWCTKGWALDMDTRSGCMFEVGELTSPGIEVRAGDAVAGAGCRGRRHRAWAPSHSAWAAQR